MNIRWAIAASAAWALAACSGAEDNPGPEAANMDSPAPANGTAPTASASGLTVVLAESPEVGRYLTDSQGRALYMMAPGTGEVGAEAEAARCTGPCLADWPAVPASAAPGPGMDGLAFGSVARDGGGQLTVNGTPLYYYTADRDPGLVSGHLLTDDFGTWHLLSPDGKPILDGDMRSKATN